MVVAKEAVRRQEEEAAWLSPSRSPWPGKPSPSAERCKHHPARVPLDM